MFVRAMEESELDYCWLVFGWLNSDLVQLVKELPLTARGGEWRLLIEVEWV